MSWSFPLFTLGGTVVRIHLTFFVLLAWVAAVSAQTGGMPSALQGVLFVVLVFVCVVAHEFGHVFAARRYGIRTPDITVLPIGGLARLEKMPDRPGAELVVAIAGPIVNFVIAAALLLVVDLPVPDGPVTEAEAMQMSLWARLAIVNILIAVFNLVPAFPLDGGRIFRALLSYRLPRARATQVAAWVGQGFALLFVVIGLLYNPILALIAVFMVFAANAESGYETQRAMAAGHTARDAMITRYEALSPEDTASRAAELLLVTTQQEFPVLRADGQLVGWVTRANLIEAMRERGGAAPVTAFMEPDTETIRWDTPLEEVLQRLQTGPAQAVAVADMRERVVGFVNRENAQELFMLDTARDARAA